MKRHDLYAPPQTHTPIPCLATLIETQARLHAHRATQRPVVTRRTLGAGALLMLALFSAGVFLPTQDTALDATLAEPAQIHRGFPSALEDAGLPEESWDDFLARL